MRTSGVQKTTNPVHCHSYTTTILEKYETVLKVEDQGQTSPQSKNL